MTDRQPHTSAPGRSDRHYDPGSSRWDPAQSTPTVDTFQNADGSITRRTYAGRVNFRGADGAITPINPTLRSDSDGRLRQHANDAGVEIAASAADPRLAVIAPAPDVSVSYRMADARPAQAVVQGDTASYTEVLPDTNVTLQSTSDGVKESLVLRTAQAGNSWLFPLQLKGLSARLTVAGTVQFVDSHGAVRAVVPPGSMHDSRVGDPAESSAVSYELVSFEGGVALKVTADGGWLHDPARVFPVTVDPTMAEQETNASTWAGPGSAGDESGFNTLYVDPDARAYMKFDALSFTYAGYRLTSASLNLRAIQSGSCDPQPLTAWLVTSYWNAPDLRYGNRPSLGAQLGSITQATPNACVNYALDLSAGDWLSVPLNVDGIQWGGGGANNGIAVGPQFGGALAAKYLGSAHSITPPSLSFDYTPNLQPFITDQYPPDNYSSATLTPTLTATAQDGDNWPSPLQYRFEVYDSNQQLIDLFTSGTPAHTLPAGILKWGQTYYWTVVANDGFSDSTPPDVHLLRTVAPSAEINLSLGQDTDGRGYDPATGNFMSSATDANIDTVGPSLSVQRSYNSFDTRFDTAFGVGWSTLADSRVVEQRDQYNALTSVRVTYPNGGQVVFGHNADGTFEAPPSRVGTMVALPSAGGYKLTDKSGTVYTYGAAASGAFVLTSIADAAGRTETFTYTGTTLSKVTSASGRSLSFGWTTPSGATRAHVATVTTDPVNPGVPTTTLVWRYNYVADKLVDACPPGVAPPDPAAPPGAASGCTHYGYFASTSQYANTLLDASPTHYWRLNETSGTTAASSVLAKEGVDNGSYGSVALGQTGGIAGTTSTAAGFNGLASQVALPADLYDHPDDQSISLWFRAINPGGVLLSYNAEQPSVVNQTGEFALPALYVGSSGKLYAQPFDIGTPNPLSTAGSVVDSAWHNVVLTSGHDTNGQGTFTLYLDGAMVGSRTATHQPFSGGLAPRYNYIGTGFLGWTWPDQPHYSQTSVLYRAPFNGVVSDVGYFDRPLDPATVGRLNTAGHTTMPSLTSVNRPGGGVHAAATYDTATGKVSRVTDANGGNWTINPPVATGSSQVYAASVLAPAPHDYWRLADASGSIARNEVHGGTALYQSVTLNTPGRFDDHRAAQFNGTSSRLDISASYAIPQVTNPQPQSIGMWFKTGARNQVLFSYQADAVAPGATTNGNYTPALYVGDNGHLMGEFWDGVTSPMSTPSAVNDNQWHHVVLSAGTSAQALYLDGAKVGSKTGTIGVINAVSANTILVGAGFLGGSWPNQTRSIPNQNTGSATFFAGSISDVAFYRSTLDDDDVAAQWRAAGQSNGLTPVTTVGVTDPTAKTLTDVYDTVNQNRVLTRTDALGNTTSFGYDTGGFLSTVVDPNGNITNTGHDVRGNIVSQTSCQNLRIHRCATSYFTYYPDDTTAHPAPDPCNDLVLSSRDGRSASPTDTTYLTTFSYDAQGNRTTILAPKIPPGFGYPSDRMMSIQYTPGGTGNSPAGLPTVTTTPGAAQQTATYTTSGDLQQLTDPVGLVTKFEYDGVGRVITKRVVADSQEQVTRYEYNTVGQVVAQTDPAVTNRVTGAVHTARTTTTYDLNGNTTAQTVTDTTGGDAPRTVSSAYNVRAQLTSYTDATGATTSYTYDVYGNKLTETDAANTRLTYAYDAVGHLLTTTLNGYVGDPNNPSSARDLVESSRAYDPAGRLASITDSMGRRTRYTYFDDGKVASTIRSDTSGAEIELESDSYDAAGNVTTRNTNNAAVTMNYEYDSGNRPTAVTDVNGLRRTTYQYSGADAITKQTQTGSGQTTTTDATYDAANRLLTSTVETTQGPVTASVTRNQLGLVTAATDRLGNTTQYAYDESGRRAVTSEPVSLVDNGTGGLTTMTPITMIGYDTFGEATESSDANGNVTTTGYDAAGRPTSIRRPTIAAGTATTTRTYNALGQIATETDPLGKATTNTYTQLGDLAKTVAPDGGVSTATYDANGERLSTTDPTGAVTQATYDYLGHQITATDIVRQPTTSAYTTTYSYNDHGQLETTRTPQGVVTTQSYDSLGQLMTSTDAAGFSTSYVYDHMGRTTRVSQSDGSSRATTFNQLGYPTAVSDTKNGTTLRTTSASYDNEGHLLSQTDAVGAQTNFHYDTRGHRIDVQQPVTGSASITSTYGYDAVGNQTRYTDGRGNAFTTTYNAWNLPATQTEPATPQTPNSADRTFTRSYDLAGRLSASTMPGGVATSYTYDDVGRLTRQSGTGAATTTTDRVFGYDLSGRLTSASALGGSNTFTYDDRGLLLSTGGPSGTSAFAYDGDGRMTSRTDAAGSTTYAYDTAGRLSRATDPLTGTQLSYQYTPASQLAQITYGSGGNVRTFGYDDLHRPTSDALKTPGGATISSIAYGYNANDDLTSKNTTGVAGAANNTYTYDLARRLTSWTSGTTTTNYSYDASGNRTQNGAATLTYNARNQLLDDGTTQYSYTARGTLASTTSGGQTTPITSDAFDQESARGVQNYTYDGLGRVATTTTSGQQARSLTYSGTGNDASGDGTALYSRDPSGTPLAVRQGSQSQLALTDQHGDMVGGFSANAALLASSTSFDPWGTRAASANPTGNLGYQSGWTDNTTGQVDMGSRWYTPTTGQFSSRDSTDNPAAPVPIAGHRYAYVGNNPLLGTDPDGQCGGWFGWVCDVGHAVADWAGDAWDGIQDAASWAWDGIQQAASWIWNGVKTVARAVVQATKWVGKQVVRAAKVATSTVRRTVQAATQVFDTAEWIVQHTVSFAARQVRSVADQINDAYKAGRADIVEAYHALQAASSRAVDAVTHFAADTGTAVAQSISTAYSAVADTVTAGARWAEHHAPAITGFVVSAAVFVGCEAVLGVATGGVGALAGAAACGAVSGAVGSVASYAVGAAQSGQFSWAELGKATLIGGAVGAITGPLGAPLGKAVGVAGSKLASAAAPLLGRTGAAEATSATSAVADSAVSTAAGGTTRTGAAAEARAGAVSCHSFDPATPVLLTSGVTKAIGNIQIGDVVFAADPATGHNDPQPVTAVHDNIDTDLTDLTVNSPRGPPSAIHTTQHHAFWDTTLGTWIDAGQLQPGHNLATPDGTTVTVQAVDNHTAAHPMRDLTVDQHHTYYVLAGTTPVLVHNCGTGGGAPREANGQLPSLTYRGDTRGPDEIFNEGFKPWGDDMDLLRHATGENAATSGYVSTSSRQSIAEEFGPNIYEIRASGGVDVNRQLGELSPYPREAEIAFPGGVQPNCILGCTLPNGTWKPNPGYSQ